MAKRCRVTTRDKLIVCEENKRKITFVNSDETEVEKVKVDGCEITDNNVNKCDYLVIKNAIERYVELKGGDIRHAIKQISSTINILSTNPSKGFKESFVISSKCPLSSAELKVYKKKFKQNFNSTLLIKNKQHTHKI